MRICDHVRRDLTETGRLGQDMGSCEHGNKTLGSVKDGEFVEWLNYH
jgi:hypothetical protein